MHAGQAALQLGDDLVGVGGEAVAQVAEAEGMFGQPVAPRVVVTSRRTQVEQQGVERACERHPPVGVGGMSGSKAGRVHGVSRSRKSSNAAATTSGWSCCRLWPQSATVTTRASAKQSMRRWSSSGSSLKRSCT